MSWLEARDQILKRLGDSGVDYKPVFCLLGPSGAGKSNALAEALVEAKRLGIPAACLNLRQYRESDSEFFDWTFAQVREQGWPFPDDIASPRLEFVRTLLKAAQDFDGRAILALDHVEHLPDDIARELVSKLREYQEKVDRAIRHRVLCVISGCVSMEDLRRRANSPNLQFDACTLPAWESASQQDAVKTHFESKGRSLDAGAIGRLADYTGGEPAFLGMLERYLTGRKITRRDVERAVTAHLGQAGDCPYLGPMAVLYWLDHELRRCADLLVANRVAHLKSGGLLADVDSMQLRGALIAEPVTPYRYQFRNEIVRRLFEGLHDARRSVRNGNPVDPNLLSLRDRFSARGMARDLGEWKAGLQSAWEMLQLGSLDRLEAKFCRGHVAKRCGEPWAAVEPNAVCEVSIARRRIEIGGNILGRDQWMIELQLAPGASFQITVRNRHLVETWLGYVARNVDHAVTLYLAEIGRANLARADGQQSEEQRRKVFVVFGRDSARKRAFYEFLRALKLDPIDWPAAKKLTGKAMPSIYEVVDAGMENAQACVVLLTGDDEAKLRDDFYDRKTDDPREAVLQPQARPNVIFEAGMALGRYQRRTVLIEFDSIRAFSDVAGFVSIRYNVDADFRQEVIDALETADCPVDRNGDAWKSAGEFAAVKRTSGATG